MKRSANHLSLLGYRKTSIFTQERQFELIELGDQLLSWQQSGVGGSPYREWLDEIDPFLFRRAVRELRELVWKSYWDRGAPDRLKVAKRTLRKNSDLAFLFCFDGNGFVREHAMKKIQGPLQSPFEVIAVLDACNNWVSEIRAQSFKTAIRCLPETPESVLASAFPVVQTNATNWERWHAEEFDQLLQFFISEGVIPLLVSDIIEGSARSPSKTLGFALKNPSIDQHLQRLFDEAKHASVRARALKTMLNKEAVWSTRYEHEWVDKPLGIRRRIPVFSSRSVQCPVDFTRLLDIAMRDKHTAVRRVAAQAIIDHRNALKTPISRFIELLLADKCSAIRSRGEYLKNHPV